MIKRRFIFLLISISFSLFLFSNFSSPQDISKKYKTWINAKRADGYLNVTGNFENDTGENISISYLLISSRDGKTGNSLTTQKGNAEIKNYEKSVLSSVKMSCAPSDFYMIKLIIYRNNREIGKDSVLYRL